MKLPEELSRQLDKLLYQRGRDRRWTQDSPVLPDVWQALLAERGERVDLLLTPHRGTRPGELAERVRELIIEARGKGRKGRKTLELDALIEHRVAANRSYVAVRANFAEVVTLLVPMSRWFQETVGDNVKRIREYAGYSKRSKKHQDLKAVIDNPAASSGDLPGVVGWWIKVLGQISLLCKGTGTEQVFSSDDDTLLQAALDLLPALSRKPDSRRLYRVSLNRRAEPACLESVRTVKGDAANKLFDIDTSRIKWAILDTGIDTRHNAFRDSRRRTRILETYDFTRIRQLIALASAPGDAAEQQLHDEFGMDPDQARNIRSALAGGGDVDWDRLRPALLVGTSTRERNRYAGELHPHGSHVAGILAGRENADTDEGHFVGMCPDIRLIDLRVLDEFGHTGEFDIIAALQFIRHLNSTGDELLVHGVNLSIQLDHDPRNFACGRTPVCEECERLVSSGVVVVAAAGNRGIDRSSANATTTEGAFQDITIADPGNAQSVITVGSTHRKRPFEYGISFFSSRGPTGDGRHKPDLVAPGERILSPVRKDEYTRLDGTSQAAPHVSGAAALLMARHTELIGNPTRVKQVLCETATDLGREKDFQGAGLVDILRALQSI